MSEEVSTFRLYLMRLLYLGNFVFLGLNVWPGITNHVAEWEPSERRCLQLLGGIVGFVGFGHSISAKDVAFASSATALQVYMVDSSLPAVEVCRPINRSYQGHGYRACCGSYCFSLALCPGNLREEAWRQMEMRARKVGLVSSAERTSDNSPPIHRRDREYE